MPHPEMCQKVVPLVFQLAPNMFRLTFGQFAGHRTPCTDKVGFHGVWKSFIELFRAKQFLEHRDVFVSI